MAIQLGVLNKTLFGISPEEASFTKRGFQPVKPNLQDRLEHIGRTFIGGYDAALLLSGNPTELYARLNEVPLESRGFAFEGAGMGLALLDYLTPWKTDRLNSFIRDYGDAHIYMLHVGPGWAMARLPWSLQRRLNRMDPLLRWLALDGYGFHQGYFHWRTYIGDRREPRLPPGYIRRAFNLGLGRSLWFVLGADVERITQTIAAFPASRQPELWSGVGLAATYAGGVTQTELETLREKASPYQAQLAQGAAFAAKARQRAGNLTPHTELASQVLCNLPALEAAQLADTALQDLSANTSELPAFELWRRRIQAHFQENPP
jgi:hypothetical protein